jgi:hypothetical protein
VPSWQIDPALDEALVWPRPVDLLAVAVTQVGQGARGRALDKVAPLTG